MLTYVYLGTNDLERATPFYDATVRDGLQRHLDNALLSEREGFATKAQRLQAHVARDRAERELQGARTDLDTSQAALGRADALERAARADDITVRPDNGQPSGGDQPETTVMRARVLCVHARVA